MSMVSSCAPEDIRKGDYVTIFIESIEIPACMFESQLQPLEEPIRVRMTPDDSGNPFKVCAICLPFVFVKHANGRLETLDVRRHKLVKLKRSYAIQVWKKLKNQHDNDECR